METISLKEKFCKISAYWDPKIIGEINDSCVKIAKLKGEFLWHAHEAQDEMFYVFQGELTIRLRDKDIRLGAGECFIIPRGVEHMPVAQEEAQVMMIEPKGTLNTGNVQNERTISDPERV